MILWPHHWLHSFFRPKTNRQKTSKMIKIPFKEKFCRVHYVIKVCGKALHLVKYKGALRKYNALENVFCTSGSILNVLKQKATR